MENKKGGAPPAPQGRVEAPGTARLGEAAGAQLPTLGSVPQQSPLLQTGNAGGEPWDSPAPGLAFLIEMRRIQRGGKEGSIDNRSSAPSQPRWALSV